MHSLVKKKQHSKQPQTRHQIRCSIKATGGFLIRRKWYKAQTNPLISKPSFQKIMK